MKSVYYVGNCRFSFPTKGVNTEREQAAIDSYLAKARRVTAKNQALRKPVMPPLPSRARAAERVALAMSGTVVTNRFGYGGQRSMWRPVKVGSPLPGPVVSRLQVRVGSEWLTRDEIARRRSLLDLAVAS